MDRWQPPAAPLNSTPQSRQINVHNVNRQPVPQVTIIRSDSTSSFIPVMVQETPSQPDICGRELGGQFGSISSSSDHKVLVSDYNPANGNLRNRCLSNGDLIEISDNNNINQPAEVSKELRNGHEQQDFNKEEDNNSQNERRTSGTSSEFKRGILFIVNKSSGGLLFDALI